MSLTSPPGNESRRLRREIRATLQEPPFSASPNAFDPVHDHFALNNALIDRDRPPSLHFCLLPIRVGDGAVVSLGRAVSSSGAMTTFLPSEKSQRQTAQVVADKP